MNSMDKRGVSFELTMWIVRLILIALLLYGISTIISIGTQSLLTTHDLDYALLLERPLYSPQGFIYHDQATGRWFPNVVDLSQFNAATLDAIFSTTKPFAIKYTLGDRTVYYNQARYEIINPLLWSEKYGNFQRNKTILVYDQGKLTPQTLVMHIVFEK